MTKNQILAEHIIATFFEAAIAYLSVNQTNLSGNTKTVAIGAVGFGISAVYNLLRQSNPSIPTIQPVTSPEAPMNGVQQLTAPPTPPEPSTVVSPETPSVPTS